MIDLKTWGDFLFTFWKFIKKYHSNDTDNMEEAIKEADSLMKKYNKPLFNGIVFGFLEQKSFESIRHQS